MDSDLPAAARVEETAKAYFRLGVTPYDTASPVHAMVVRLAGGDPRGLARNTAGRDLAHVCGGAGLARLVRQCIDGRVLLPEEGQPGPSDRVRMHQLVNARIAELKAAGVVNDDTKWMTAGFALGGKYFADLRAIARARPRDRTSDGAFPLVLRAWVPEAAAWLEPAAFLALPRPGVGLQREPVFDVGSLPSVPFASQSSVKAALLAGAAWLEAWAPARGSKTEYVFERIATPHVC